MPDQPISQEAARTLLAALKALVAQPMTKITGTTYTLDSYRQACIAVTMAEGTATVTH